MRIPKAEPPLGAAASAAPPQPRQEQEGPEPGRDGAAHPSCPRAQRPQPAPGTGTAHRPKGLWSISGAQGTLPAPHGTAGSSPGAGEESSGKASPREARCPLMSMNHRHALQIPVNEMSNTHHSKPRAGGGERTSAAEPSPLSPDSTIHIYGKGGERKEYIFRGLYNSSFAHRSLSLSHPPSPCTPRWLLHFPQPHKPLCHQHSQQKRRVWQCTSAPGAGHKDTLSPHSVPTSLWRQPPLHQLHSEPTANTESTRHQPKICNSTPGMPLPP